MQNIQALWSWLTHNPLTVATLIFAGAALAITLYGYVYKYAMLTERD
jgi:hypothetical protein